MKKANSEAQILSWWASAPVKTVVACARALGLSKETVAKALDKAGVERDRTHRIAESREKMAAVEELRAALEPMWHEAYKNVVRKAIWTPPRFPYKLVFSDDQHGTFCDPVTVQTIVDREGGRDTAMVFFEPFTLDGFSRFRATYRASAAEELGAMDFAFKLWHDAYDHLLLGVSNHGTRFTDWVANKTDDSTKAEDAAKAWAGLFEKYITHRGKLEQFGTHTIQVGTVLCSHLRAYMKHGASTVGRVAEHCAANAPSLCLRPPWQIVAMGHTHRVQDVPLTGGRWHGWEVGCSCHLPEYAANNSKPSAASTIPMEKGYGRLVWNRHGELDITESRVVRLGYADIPTEVL
jgi:hypothetical protein